MTNHQTTTIQLAPVASIFSVLAAIGLLITSGLLAGNLTRRWGDSTEFEQARQLLLTFPTEIGSWQLDGERNELSEKAINILQCKDAYVAAHYVHSATNARIGLTLIAGPYGPLSVHKPDVCYPNAGLPTKQQPQRQTVNAGEPSAGTFWVAEFQSAEPGSLPQQVYYAWSKGEDWQAASIPRFAFGGAPVLFKIQLDAPLDRSAEQADDNPCVQFLNEFLPLWQEKLAPQLRQSPDA